MSIVLFGVCNVSPYYCIVFDFCESSFEKEKNQLFVVTLSDGEGDSHNTQLED